MADGAADARQWLRFFRRHLARVGWRGHRALDFRGARDRRIRLDWFPCDGGGWRGGASRNHAPPPPPLPRQSPALKLSEFNSTMRARLAPASAEGAQLQT